MTLDEIEERVTNSLGAMNTPEELYDWRLTFFNSHAWLNVQEGCYALSENRLSEADLKSLIGVFRERSEISFIDFHIKAPEPGPEEFDRMARLFGPLRNDVRLLPPRDAKARKAYTQQKILASMRLMMETRQPISEKLRQQFNWMMIRTQNTERTPEMMAVHLQFADYNSYRKVLIPGAPVSLTQHRMEEKDQEATTPAPAPMFPSSFGTDNSDFESRLAPVKVTHRIQNPRPPQKIDLTAAKDWGTVGDVVVSLAVHELPSEIHEEFAAYCENLYDRMKDAEDGRFGLGTS